MALSVGESTTPNVSLSAQAHSAGWPDTPGRQAAEPPSDPAEVVTASGELPMKLLMNEPDELPVRLPPMNKMIWVPSWYTLSTTWVASPRLWLTMVLRSWPILRLVPRAVACA